LSPSHSFQIAALVQAAHDISIQIVPVSRFR